MRALAGASAPRPAGRRGSVTAPAAGPHPGRGPAGTRRGRRDHPGPAGPGGGGAAAVGARRAHRPGARPRPGPPVLAVRRPGGPRHLADRGAARGGRARRLGARARGRCTRRGGHGPRAAEPLPAAARGPLPVHRGRDRDHPDPADAGRGRPGRPGLGAGLRRPEPGQHGLRCRTQRAVRGPGRGSARRTRRACSTWPRSCASPGRGRWCTAAARPRCWTPWRSTVPGGRRARCTWSGSPRWPPRPGRSGPSRWNWPSPG